MRRESKLNWRWLANQPGLVGVKHRPPSPPSLAHIREDDPGTPQQPLEPASREEIHAERTDVHRDLPHALVPVYQAERTAGMGEVADGPDVLNRSGREVDVRRRHQRRDRK